MPSIAADVMPPAYPAPSPHGKIPLIFDNSLSSLTILTGDDVLLSTPSRIASSLLYPFMFFEKPSTHSFNASHISFEKILTLISKPDLEGVKYFIESDVKNQNKTTIKINANEEANILNKIYLPDHYSAMKELGRGRLLFYVKFKNSTAVINKTDFERLFNIKL